jgi:hypothetical protein
MRHIVDAVSNVFPICDSEKPNHNYKIKHEATWALTWLIRYIVYVCKKSLKIPKG